MSRPTRLDDLLLELERGDVEPERYSRKSLYGRCEPLIGGAALAVLAIGSGALLGGWTPADECRHVGAAPRRELLPRSTGRHSH